MKHSMSILCPCRPFNEAPIGWRDRGADRGHATWQPAQSSYSAWPGFTQTVEIFYIAMTLPWLCHDFAMTLPWLCHDFAMTLPWCPTCSTHNSNSELFWLLAVAWENSANIRGSPIHTERKSRNMNSAGDKSTWTWSRRKCFRMQHHALWKHWSRETS